MTYDFNSITNRLEQGSVKWQAIANKIVADDHNVVPLSMADSDMAMAPEIISGLREFLNTAILGYTDFTPAYLNAVTTWFSKRHNWTFNESDIVFSPGVIPAMYTTINAFTNPGDGVIIMPPVYPPFASSIENTKRVVVTNDLKRVGNTYEIDFEDLAKKAAQPTNKLLMLCSPHNPVGRVWTKEELTKLADICIKNNLIVFSDEIHADLILNNRTHYPLSSLSNEIAERTIVATAPSKTFNLAGMSTSNMIITNPDLRAKFIETKKIMGGSEPTILGLKACEIAYLNCSTWVDEFLALIATNHEVVKTYFNNNFPAVTVFELEGTYLQWVDFNSFNISHTKLEQLLNEAQLFVNDGATFGKNGTNYIRINLACPTSILKQALERLTSPLNNLSK